MKSEKGFISEEVVALLVLAVTLFLVVFRGAFVSEKVAVRALEKQGYSNIRITEHDWFAIGLRGCDGGDAAKFTAKVTNPAGKKAEVFVCIGWIFKGATVRSD